MNNTHVSSKVNTTKGKVKEEIGHMVGDKSLAGEGVKDQLKGKIQNVVADAKDGLKRAVDKFLDKDSTTKTH